MDGERSVVGQLCVEILAVVPEGERTVLAVLPGITGVVGEHLLTLNVDNF